MQQTGKTLLAKTMPLQLLLLLLVWAFSVTYVCVCVCSNVVEKCVSHSSRPERAEIIEEVCLMTDGWVLVSQQVCMCVSWSGYHQLSVMSLCQLVWLLSAVSDVTVSAALAVIGCQWCHCVSWSGRHRLSVMSRCQLVWPSSAVSDVTVSVGLAVIGCQWCHCVSCKRLLAVCWLPVAVCVFIMYCAVLFGLMTTRLNNTTTTTYAYNPPMPIPFTNPVLKICG